MTISLLCTRVLQSSAPSRYRPPSVRLCASSSWCLGDLHTQRATAARSLFHQQERRNHHRPHQFPPPPIEEVEQWYHILDLYPGASPEQIKTAHRKLVMKVNTDHDRTRDKTVYTNVNAARYGLRDLMKEHSEVYERYVKLLRARRKQRKQIAAAAQPPRSSSPQPNPAESLLEKWRKEEAAKEAWQRKQDRAREAALTKARQKTAQTARSRPAPDYHEQPGQRTSPSSRQEQRQNQTSRPSASQEPKEHGEGQASNGKDRSEASADRSQMPEEKVDQQPQSAKARSSEINKDSLNARLVVVHGLLQGTTEKLIFDALSKLRPGAVAQMKLSGTSAWIEFYRAEAASTLQMLITTQKLRVHKKLISVATVENSSLRPPPRDSLTSRVLLIRSLVDTRFSSWEIRALTFHLRQHGVDEPIEIRKEGTPDGDFLRVEYASWRGQAETAKAVIERTRPSLKVQYDLDPCETPSRLEPTASALNSELEGKLPERRMAPSNSFGTIALRLWVGISLATILWSTSSPKEKESPSRDSRS